MVERVPMPTCPMAEMCRGMMTRRTPRYALIIPGVLLIAVGVAVLIEPRILTWLVGVVLILMGSAALMIMNFMRNVGERLQRNNGQAAGG